MNAESLQKNLRLLEQFFQTVKSQNNFRRRRLSVSTCSLSFLSSNSNWKKNLLEMVFFSQFTKYVTKKVFSNLTWKSLSRPVWSKNKHLIFQKKCCHTKSEEMLYVYPKYYKHWPYLLAYTMDCVCRKITLNNRAAAGFSNPGGLAVMWWA